MLIKDFFKCVKKHALALGGVCILADLVAGGLIGVLRLETGLKLEGGCSYVSLVSGLFGSLVGLVSFVVELGLQIAFLGPFPVVVFGVLVLLIWN